MAARFLNSRTPWIVHLRRGVVGCITATSVLEARQDLKERGTRKTHCLGLQSFPPFLACRGTLPIFTEAPVSLWQQRFQATETRTDLSDWLSIRSFEIDALAQGATRETSPIRRARMDVLRIRHGGCLHPSYGSGQPRCPPTDPARGKGSARGAGSRAPGSVLSLSHRRLYHPVECSPFGLLTVGT